ncbi:type II secretion system protein GspJ [Shewanella sp. NFH-SH190041]|uniref:type II secretion system minor pseudopilin GspJ n=1 Tax=Shewanella sp. NFH-SH190041 TaxID=2950245 RepID=UPI0021C2C17E|nr:type II secretion system minor pseudopilin GspJ [Shewanella sp. NFH-SH190041]BDM62647.1 type II secretion system protein GspJ [Shewanella sp. NFH-SH190041]
MWHVKSNASRGFTLLEMLIAIAIFAMLGLAANAVLQTVMTNDEVTKQFAARLKALQQGVGIMQRDLGQMVGRTPRLLEGGRSKALFQAGPHLLDSQSDGLSFFRLGWLNPEGMLPRGSIQAVAYVQVEDRLERWYFPYPDPELGAEPIKTVLMTGVLEVKYAFFINGSWQRQVDGTTMPQAIAVDIELEHLGRIERKFLLPELGSVTPESGGNDQPGRDGDDRGAPDGRTPGNGEPGNGPPPIPGAPREPGLIPGRG